MKKHMLLIGTSDGSFVPFAMLFPVNDVPDELMMKIGRVKPFMDYNKIVSIYGCSIDQNGKYSMCGPEEIQYWCVVEDNTYVPISKESEKDIEDLEHLMDCSRPAFEDMFLDTEGHLPKYIMDSYDLSYTTYGKNKDVDQYFEGIKKLTTVRNQPITIDEVICIKRLFEW